MQYHYSEHSRKTTEARLRSHEQTHAARAQEEDGVSYDGLVLLGAHAIAAATSLEQMKQAAQELGGVLIALVSQLDEDIAFLNEPAEKPSTDESGE